MDRSVFSSVMLSYCSVLSALGYAVSAFWECEFFLLLIFLCLLTCWRSGYCNSVPWLWLCLVSVASKNSGKCPTSLLCHQFPNMNFVEVFENDTFHVEPLIPSRLSTRIGFSLCFWG